MTKIGSGRLTLAGFADIVGTLTLSAGSLALARNADIMVEDAFFTRGTTLYADLAGDDSDDLGRMFVLGEAHIDTGAGFGLLNTSQLAVGETVSHAFLSAYGGLSGDFAAVSSATLDIQLANDGINYRFTATRTAEVVDAIGDQGGSSNAQGLFDAIDAIAVPPGGEPNATQQLLLDIMNQLENTPAADFIQVAEEVTRSFSPETVAQSVASVQSNNTFAANTMQGMFNSFESSGAAMAAMGVRSQDAMARLGGPGGMERVFIATPLAQWTRIKPPGFSRVKDFTGGVSLGVGLRRENDFTVGFGAYYLRSDTDSATASIDTDTLGFNLYGRKYFTSTGPRWFAEGGLGFAHGWLDQQRVDGARVPPVLFRSKTQTRLFNASIGTGFDFQAGRAITLTPHLGFDYNHINTSDYTESGGELRLFSSPDNFNSFQGVAGLKMKAHLTDAFFLTTSAAYRHEFADRHTVVRNQFVGSPEVRFATEGYKQNRSRGELGAGFGWEPAGRLSVGADYQLRLAQKQTSHAVLVSVGVKF